MRNPHRPSGIAITLLVFILCLVGAGTAGVVADRAVAGKPPPTQEQQDAIHNIATGLAPVSGGISLLVESLLKSLWSPAGVAAGAVGVAALRSEAKAKTAKKESKRKSKAIADLWEHVPDAVPDEKIDPQSLALAHTVVSDGKKHAAAVHT